MEKIIIHFFWSDVMHEQHQTLDSHVFTYSLDVFEEAGGVPAYSATNPQDYRFDVIRVYGRGQ